MKVCWANITFFFFFFILHYLLLHNDPAAHQDHCGKYRIRTWDLCILLICKVVGQNIETKVKAKIIKAAFGNLHKMGNISLLFKKN